MKIIDTHIDVCFMLYIAAFYEVSSYKCDEYGHRFPLSRDHGDRVKQN
jgi:hypothetical protein